MSAKSWWPLKAVTLLSTGVALGWAARGLESPAAGPPPPRTLADACRAVAASPVQVLRVESPPSEGMPPQIARCAAAPQAARGRPATAALLQAIERGSDQERQDALLAARGQQLALPDELLRSRWETDPSEGVRLLALEALVERLNGDTAGLRALLQATRVMPGAALQRRAAEALEELDERERSDAANPQPGVPPG